ncbi:MAG TPA: succinic semialdehyde dehydrogenase [Rubrobacteraceae bacterium]|nr:succinic semialdehyde dehydrogenase [Rubrobacteraceae bacterium]
MNTKPSAEKRRTGNGLLARLASNITLADAAREEIPVEMPFTGGTLGRIPRCTAKDVEEATRRARAAQAWWAETSFSERAGILLRFHDLVLDLQEEALDLIQKETGKARKHAFEEVLDTAITARYYANAAETHLKPRRRQGALPLLTTTREYHHPRGVAGFIVPWNYPLSLGISDAIPALLAGNGAIIKPDEKTPYSTLWAVEQLYEAGLPEDLVQVVTGYGTELGEPIVDNVDFVMFTGSTHVGRIVARQAAERLVDYSMELSGKNAMIVLDDANLEKTIPGAERAIFSSGGQLCISMERLYVQSGIYDEFKRRLTKHVGNMKLGANLDYSADMGSIISAEQLERVEKHVEDAVSKGARVLTGGRPRPDLGPYFYEPTILEGVSEDASLRTDETFGPVAALYKFDTLEEAIAKANDSPYGLNFSVWTEDLKKGRGLATRLEAGTVNVNEAYAAAWASLDAPMGGFKDSGVGRRHGACGIRKYTESQTVAVQRGVPVAALPGMDEKRYARLMSGALKILRRMPGVR